MVNLVILEYQKEATTGIADNVPDLIVLDIELPDGNGFDYCEKLSRNPILSNTPIIILTSKSEVSEKVMGLHSGADDYITKPFSTHELRARVESKLRKKAKVKATQFDTEEYSFNVDFQKATCNFTGNDLDLTPTEFRILYTLAKKPDSAFTRRELVKAVWSDAGFNIETKGLDTHISHLRKKMGEYSSRIISIYGKGYSFSPKANKKSA